MKPSLSIERLSVGELQTNCYIVGDPVSQEILVIDPGDSADFIAQKLEKAGKLVGIVATHGHFDHILGAFELQEIFNIPFYIHEKDMFLLQTMTSTAKYYLRREIIEIPPRNVTHLTSGFTIPLGNLTFIVAETPGHTPGGVCLYCKAEEVIFSGDTIFADGLVGDVRHKYSDKDSLLKSLKSIFTFPDSTTIYPGHGEKTTLGKEKLLHRGFVRP